MTLKVCKILYILMLACLLVSTSSFAARPGGAFYETLSTAAIGSKTQVLSRDDLRRLPPGATWGTVIGLFEEPFHSSLGLFAWVKERSDVDYTSDSLDIVLTNSYWFMFEDYVNFEREAVLLYVASFDQLAEFPDSKTIPEIIGQMTINWPPSARGMAVNHYINNKRSNVSDAVERGNDVESRIDCIERVKVKTVEEMINEGMSSVYFDPGRTTVVIVGDING